MHLVKNSSRVNPQVNPAEVAKAVVSLVHSHECLYRPGRYRPEVSLSKGGVLKYLGQPYHPKYDLLYAIIEGANIGPRLLELFGLERSPSPEWHREFRLEIIRNLEELEKRKKDVLAAGKALKEMARNASPSLSIDTMPKVTKSIWKAISDLVDIINNQRSL